MKKENVAIIGASDKPERYAYKAMKLLIEYGHNVFLVSPSHQEINGMTVYSSITEINEKIDTVTLYISDRLQNADVQEGILNATPKRVIFNPGTENKQFEKKCAQKNISPDRECTLVLLRTNQF